MAAVASVLARLNPFVSTARSGVASGSARPAQTLDIQQSIAALEDKRSEVAADVARARASLSRWTGDPNRSEGHPSELQSLMRISYAVFCLQKKTTKTIKPN